MEKLITLKSYESISKSFILCNELMEIESYKLISREGVYIYETSITEKPLIDSKIAININYGANYDYSYVNKLYEQYQTDRYAYNYDFKLQRFTLDNCNNIKICLNLSGDYIYWFIVRTYVDFIINNLRIQYGFYEYELDMDWYKNDFFILLKLPKSIEIDEVVFKFESKVNDKKIPNELVEYAFKSLLVYLRDPKYAEIVSDIELSKYLLKERTNEHNEC